MLDQPSASPNPSPTIARGTRTRNNASILGLILAGALACMCVCGAFLAWNYVAPSIPSVAVQPTVAPTSTRRTSPTAPAPATTTPTTAQTNASTFPKKWTPTQVVAAFQSARVEVQGQRPMTSEDYGSVPRTATEAWRFFLPSLGGQKGGRIFFFATPKDLQAVQRYYESVSGPRPWIFVKDNLLLQLHSDLSEARAKQYENALNALR